MKVEAIRLINFMAFEDTGWIELRPITLLFGRNSSGKSAIIRALLLLKQSLDAAGDERPLAFVREDGLVDLGNFPTAVHRKPGEGPGESQKRDHLERNMIFGFRCDLTDDPALKQVRDLIQTNYSVPLSEEALRQLRIEFLIGFGWHSNSVSPGLLTLHAVGPELSIVMLTCERLSESVLRELDRQHSFVLHSDVATDPNLDEQTIGLYLRDERGFWTTFASPVPQSFQKLDGLLEAVQDGVEEFLRGITHIGPIRPMPERVYALRATDAPRYAREGLKGWHEFLRDRVAETDKAKAISDWMQRLGLADSVKVQADKDRNPITRSQIFFDDKAVNVNVKDAGFGASQVLPVVVAAVLAEPEALVVIQQPELHLHPGAQAELMELFLQVSQKRALFVLETHSEAMLLRARLRHAQHAVKARQSGGKPVNALSVLYVERDDCVSRTANLELDAVGRFVDPPPSLAQFFSPDLDDLSKLSDIQFDHAE